MWLDTSATDFSLYIPIIITFIEAEILGTAGTAWAAQHHCIEGRRQTPFVVDIGAGDRQCERHATPIRQDVTLAPAFRSVRRIRARLVPPFGAFTEALSIEVQSRPTPCSASYRSMSFFQSSRKTSCSTHSPNRRCTVDPFGSAFHGQPVRSRYTTCANRARDGSGGRPPYSFSGSTGISGSTSFHNSSGTSSFGNRVVATHRRRSWPDLRVH